MTPKRSRSKAQRIKKDYARFCYCHHTTVLLSYVVVTGYTGAGAYIEKKILIVGGLVTTII